MDGDEYDAFTSNDYGWLRPDGKFTQVGWGDHMNWAYEEVERRGWYQEAREYEDAHNVCEAIEDFLVQSKGYVLIHDPAFNGIPAIEVSKERSLTKAQSEYLFSFFYDRGYKDEAKKYLA